MYRKKWKISVLVFLFIVPLSGSAFADEGWTSPLEIIGILVNDESLEIKLQGGTDRCDRVFQLYTTEPNYNVKSSALLSAYYAGHEVDVYWSGTLNRCDTKVEYFKVRR